MSLTSSHCLGRPILRAPGGGWILAVWFLPQIRTPSPKWLEVAAVGPFGRWLAHLDGLNLSRAGCSMASRRGSRPRTRARVTCGAALFHRT
jgi:hypothetical protein